MGAIDRSTKAITITIIIAMFKCISESLNAWEISFHSIGIM